MSTAQSEVLIAPVKSKAKQKLAEASKGPVDMIASTATFVENLVKEDAYGLVPALMDNANFDYFKLGGVLSVIRNNKWWTEEYGEGMKFTKFVELKFGLNYRKAMYLIQIYDDLVASGVAWDQVKDIGWTKLKEISGVITTDNVEEWVAIAKELTTLELAERVAKSKVQSLETSGAEPIESAEAKTTTSMSFKLHKDQKETIVLAIEKAKKEAGTEFDGVALEAICLNYLSGGKTTKPKNLKAVMESYSPQEILNTFSAIWPEIDVSATLPAEL